MCCDLVRSFLLLLNIDGDDSKLSCELHRGKYSWVGPASEGGYLGSDVDELVSAIVSGAAGTYVGQLVSRDAGIDIGLVVEPGQHVRIVNGAQLPGSRTVSWGSGGLSVSPRAVLVLVGISFDGALVVEAGASVTLQSVVFGLFACLTVRGNGAVVLRDTVAPRVCSDCDSIEHCDTSQCTAAGIAVCAACQDGYYSMRHNDDPGRCLTASVSLQIAGGLTDDATGMFAFRFRSSLPSDLGEDGMLSVPHRVAISLAGTGEEVIGATITLSSNANSLTLERLILSGELVMTNRASLNLLDCVLHVEVLSAMMRPLPVDNDPKPLSHMTGAETTVRLDGCTIPEHPEWGALSGSIVSVGSSAPPLYNPYSHNEYPDTAQHGPVYYDPPFLGRLPTSYANFTVLSGPCTTRGNGRCVGRPEGYGPREQCEIVVNGTGVLAPTRLFDTQPFQSQGYDVLFSGSELRCSDCRQYGGRVPSLCGAYMTPCPRRGGVIVDQHGFCPPGFHVCQNCGNGLPANSTHPYCDRDADCYCDAVWCNNGQQRSNCAHPASENPVYEHCNDGCWWGGYAHDLVPPEGMVFEDGHTLTWKSEAGKQGGNGANGDCTNYACEGICTIGLCGYPATDGYDPTLGGGWEVCFL